MDLLDKKSLNFFKDKKILITAASTHFNEEEFVIKPFILPKNYKNIISIVVPRHVERTEEICQELEKFSLKFHKHSSLKRLTKKPTFILLILMVN